MKYFVFSIAALGVPPLACLLALNSKWSKYVIWGMLVALCFYQGTAINFFSHEGYRGTARGMEVSIIYLFAAALLMVSAIKFRFPGLFPTTGSKLYLLYFLLCLPSWGAAENTLYCWLETWKMIMLYLVYLSVRAYLNMTDNMNTIVRGFSVVVIWNFLMIVKAHLMGDYQPHGIFPHQNSMVMAMHMLGNVYFAFYIGRGARRHPFMVVSFVLAAGSLVRSYSRAGIAIMPVSYAITMFAIWLKSPDVTIARLCRRIAPLAVLGLVGLAAMLPRIIERFNTAPEASKNTRIELAQCAAEMIRDEPWRGVGINNWGIKINPPYEYAERAGREPNRGEDFRDGIVETVYLLVGAECGIPALAAMILWFLYYLVLAFRLIKRLSGTWLSCIPAGMVGGLFACYLQSCLEWVLRQQINLVILMFFFAMLDHLLVNYRPGAMTAGLDKGRTRNEKQPAPAV